MGAGQGRPGSGTFVAVALAGALAVAFAPRLPSAALALSVLVLSGLAAIAFRARPLATFALLVFVAASGAAWTAFHAGRAVAAFLPVEAVGTEAVIEGRVVGLPLHGPDGLVALVEVEAVLAGTGAVREALPGHRVELRWFRAGLGVVGERRGRWTVGLDRPPPSRGPGLDDAARRAVIAGTVAVARVRGGSPALDLGDAPGVPAIIDRWREDVSARMVQRLGPVPARYVRALSIGDTRGLVEADWTLLRRFGLTHLVAISGFHVALVALLGIGLVRGLWWLRPGLASVCPRPVAAAWGAFLVAGAYAVVAGASLPTVRTALMIGIVAAARTLRWPVSPMQPLALAVAAVLVVDPLAVLTPGFWLSCGGVALLVWGCEDRPGRPVLAFLRAQWVASLGLGPVLAAAFLAVPGLGPLANLVAIPWISLGVVPLAVLGVGLSALGAAAASEWAWRAAGGLMGVLESALSRVPAEAAVLWPVPPPGLPALAAAAVGIAWLLMPRGVPGRAAGWLLLLPVLWPASSRPEAGGLEVWVFDLPRGEAVLVRSAGHEVLVDAGPPGSGLPQALQALGLRRIDLMVQTRSNAGRAGGVTSLRQALPVDAHWRPPGHPDGADTLQGRTWRVDGLALDVLHPHADFPAGGADAGAVLRVRAPGGEVVIAGDADRWIAARAARAGASPGLVLAGAPTLAAWSDRFPSAVAVATRAPGPAAARRWPADRPHPGAEGTLRLRLDPRGRLEVQSWRALHPRWWDGG